MEKKCRPCFEFFLLVFPWTGLYLQPLQLPWPHKRQLVSLVSLCSLPEQEKAITRLFSKLIYEVWSLAFVNAARAFINVESLLFPGFVAWVAVTFLTDPILSCGRHLSMSVLTFQDIPRSELSHVQAPGKKAMFYFYIFI